jgi:hypothetical protein
MEKYENEEIFRIAAFLDPRWKIGWCKEDEIEELKHIILQKGRRTQALESCREELVGPSLQVQRSPQKRNQNF